MAEAHQAREKSRLARETLRADYRRVRADTEGLCGPLSIEDHGLQTMPDVSPAKWHLAHTSWFFEAFLLARFVDGYRPHNPAFDHLFNSYYVTHGEPFPRPHRGFLSRPAVDEIYEYRRAVERSILGLIERADDDAWRRIEPLIVLGLNHEQQHQELLLTDIKHAFSFNPLRPVYRADLPIPSAFDPPATEWLEYPGGLYEIGAAATGFAFDNEQPRHRVWLDDFALADRPVTNAEYLAFIEDGAYGDPRWWLSEGWAAVQAEGWQAPMYWDNADDGWQCFTLGGMRPVDPAAPVSHISYFEADAYARWAGRRLPTEAEWEVAAAPLVADADNVADANLRDAGYLQPIASQRPLGPRQFFGDVWEWTASAYAAYPGFRIAEGPIGEYNGKFMCGQMVLRGGSCVTPDDHIRASYRNFFHPQDRWQFSGLRLADDR